MLHTISHQTARQWSQLNLLTQGWKQDALLFLGDGCYALLRRAVQNLLAEQQLLVLHSDAAARGLLQRLPEQVQCIDYSGFVQLSLQHKVIQAWP